MATEDDELHNGMEMPTNSFIRRRAQVTDFVVRGHVVFLSVRGKARAAFIPAANLEERLGAALCAMLDERDAVSANWFRSNRTELPWMVASGGRWWTVNGHRRMALVPADVGRAFLAAQEGKA